MEMNAMRKFAIAGIILGSAALSGCASSLGVGNPNYSCQAPVMGEQGGVKCMSAREVYELTEQPGPVRFDQIQRQRQQAQDAQEEQQAKDPLAVKRQAKAAEEPMPPVADNSDPLAMSPIHKDPIPLRTRADIMRIWVAPWEGTNGDLNVSGMVFTELDGRRWNIGVQEDVQPPTLSPLQQISPMETSE